MLSLRNIPIRVNEQGVCLDDLWLASGVDTNLSPSCWLQEKATQQTLIEMSLEMSTSVDSLVSSCEGLSYAKSELAQMYASWVDAEYGIEVINLLLEFDHARGHTAKEVTDPVEAAHAFIAAVEKERVLIS
ncbi:hypothetical protein [Zooshikella harenae]|uniref:Uncharacterized protein n=1 Tax=Zooshikella harenae TaxID=2827238 RepID=A0ABS5Z9J9_9GAMM|nr:hypothetical protein [Zooshikella harenae]MBU2709996.1 hypothetical protein [Zooshikella harenae]